MPTTATDAFGALLYSAKRGFRFERMPILRRRALGLAGVREVGAFEAHRLPSEGRGNLGLYRIDYAGISVFQKMTTNTREFRMAKVLARAGESASHPRVLLCATRGPILHIFQEFVGEECRPVSPEVYATLASDFSAVATRVLGQVAPKDRLTWMESLSTPAFVAKLAQRTGLHADQLRRGLSDAMSQPRAVVHNDLHSSNIRQRNDGTPVAIDFGGVGWSLQGAEYYRLLPKQLTDDSKLEMFEETTAIAARLLGQPVEEVRRAAYLAAAARHARFARHRRDKAREEQALICAARAL